MSDDVPLKPCPFCGSSTPPVVRSALERGAWRECSQCLACGGLGVGDDGDEASAHAWNRRAVDVGVDGGNHPRLCAAGSTCDLDLYLKAKARIERQARDLDEFRGRLENASAELKQMRIERDEAQRLLNEQRADAFELRDRKQASIDEAAGYIATLATQVAELEAKLHSIDLTVADACKRNGFAPYGNTILDIATLGDAFERAVAFACRSGARALVRGEAVESAAPLLTNTLAERDEARALVRRLHVLHVDDAPASTGAVLAVVVRLSEDVEAAVKRWGPP